MPMVSCLPLRKVVLMLFPWLLLSGCGAPERTFFMRYQSDNPADLALDIERQTEELKRAQNLYDIFVRTIDLAGDLTIAGREADAITLLEFYADSPVLDTAAHTDVAWFYLNYATASQYAGMPEQAEKYFRQAGSFVEKHELTEVQHYVYHHYGRFLVEQRQYERAEAYFRQALQIRIKLSDARAANTQQALDTLSVLLVQ